jgi:hypothetical protein
MFHLRIKSLILCPRSRPSTTTSTVGWHAYSLKKESYATRHQLCDMKRLVGEVSEPVSRKAAVFIHLAWTVTVFTGIKQKVHTSCNGWERVHGYNQIERCLETIRFYCMRRLRCNLFKAYLWVNVLRTRIGLSFPFITHYSCKQEHAVE